MSTILLPVNTCLYSTAEILTALSVALGIDLLPPSNIAVSNLVLINYFKGITTPPTAIWKSCSSLNIVAVDFSYYMRPGQFDLIYCDSVYMSYHDLYQRCYRYAKQRIGDDIKMFYSAFLTAYNLFYSITEGMDFTTQKVDDVFNTIRYNVQFNSLPNRNDILKLLDVIYTYHINHARIN